MSQLSKQATGAPVPSNPVIGSPSEAQRQFPGYEVQTYEVPPGPAWGRPGPVTNINMAYPSTVLSAIVDAGFLHPTGRSDAASIMLAIMRLIDSALGAQIEMAIAKEDAAKAAAETSWGFAPKRMP